MVGSRLFTLALAVVLLFASFAGALNANFSLVTPSNGLVERAASSLINFSVGSMNVNISRVEVNITGSINADPDSFTTSTNGTSSSGANFSNSTYSTNLSNPSLSHIVTMTFANTTGLGFINNQTTQNFWFNITGRSMFSALINVLITVTGIDGTTNSTTLTFGSSFRFSGYVKNETGGYQNGTNVTLYRFTENQNGPPTETSVASALTDANGSFTISEINSSGGLSYVLKFIYYNESGVATKVGTILPPFPADMFYPQSFSGAYEFMKPPSLNGTTFYLGSAATINITATNGTSQLFGYMLMEQSTGFPISSNVFGNVSSAQIVVPTNRQYTIMALRAHSQFTQFNTSICDGNFMNNTACPTPPKSNSSINPTTNGQRIDVIMNLTINRVYMYGCINVTGNSTPINNVTAILPRMLPWTGFVPPMTPDTQDIDVTNPNQLNHSDYRCPGAVARYNISLLNSNYLVEFYGRNSSADSAAEWKGAFQNVSFEGQSAGTDNGINVTLAGLAGLFVAAGNDQGDTNKSEITINIQNSSGGAITQDKPHVDIHVRNSVFGEMTYIIEDFSNGTFTLSLPLNSTAKVKIFSNNAPPKEKALNLSTPEINITLTTMSDGNAGFKRVNSSGGLEDVNVTNSSFDMGMNFIRNTADCNVINYSNSSCSLSSVDVDSFNPFTVLVAGKVNMEMKLKSSNVSIIFYNFDMFSAKQPPMESVMDNQASSGGSSSNQIWQFGSFVPPDVYDYAVVVMPYSDSVINDSRGINVSIPVLYDENWNSQWNYSSGSRLTNLTTSIDDYLGSSSNRSFNSSGYRDFFSGGVNCSKTNYNVSSATAGSYCYVNASSNMIYMRVPHFSGVAPNLLGTAITSTTPEDDDGSNNGGGSSVTVGGATTTLTTTQFDNGFTKQLASKDKIKFNVSNESHTMEVMNVTSSTLTVKVTSTPQTASVSLGETKKFELTGDNIYDMSVSFNRAVLFGNSTYRADITIKADSANLTSSTTGTNGNANVNSGVSSNNVSSNNTLGNQDQSQTESSKLWLWILIGVLVLAIAFLAYLWLKKKTRYKIFGF